jgi:hypothetical protein
LLGDGAHEVDNVAQALVAQLAEAGLTLKAPSRGDAHAHRPFGNGGRRGADVYDLAGGYETSIMVAGGANLLAVLVALTLPRQKRAQ